MNLRLFLLSKQEKNHKIHKWIFCHDTHDSFKTANEWGLRNMHDDFKNLRKFAVYLEFPDDTGVFCERIGNYSFKSKPNKYQIIAFCDSEVGDNNCWIIVLFGENNQKRKKNLTFLKIQTVFCGKIQIDAISIFKVKI